MKEVTTAILLLIFLTPLPVYGEKKNLTPQVSLHMAVLQGNIGVIRQYIKAGSDLNEKDAYGSTPLIISTTFGNAEAAKALIEAGADMAIRDSYGSQVPFTLPLFYATQRLSRPSFTKGLTSF